MSLIKTVELPSFALVWTTLQALRFYILKYTWRHVKTKNWYLRGIPGKHGGAPIWRQENSENISNLLWLPRKLIKKTSIYISNSPNALTSESARNHEIIIFSTNSIVALCHAPPY